MITELALALLFVLPVSVQAGKPPAAPPPAVATSASGSWTGQMQFVSTVTGDKTPAQSLYGATTLNIRPNLKVDGIAPQLGCRFVGVAQPAPVPGGQDSLTMDVEAAGCKSIDFNRKYKGTLTIHDGSQVVNVSLKTTQGKFNYELFGPMQRPQRR